MGSMFQSFVIVLSSHICYNVQSQNSIFFRYRRCGPMNLLVASNWLLNILLAIAIILLALQGKG